MRRAELGRNDWHVFSRGCRRMALYQDADDRRKFLSILKVALFRTGCIVLGYVLMSNHYHLVLSGTSVQLTACMRRINQWYSAYHNDKYSLSGTAFEGPYRAYPQPSFYVLVCRLAYVFLNPVAANLVKRPEDYRWSSIFDYLGRPGSPLSVNPLPILNRLSDDLTRAREHFRKVLEREARAPKRGSSDPLNYVEINAHHFAWLLEHAIEMEPQFGGEDPTLIAIYWASQCGVPPKAMAKVLGDINTVRIRQMICRIKKRMAEHPELAKRLPVP